MNQLTKRILILMASVFFLSTAAATWPQSMTGSISGVVTDSSGAVLPGVSVAATAESTNVKQTTVTDSKGFYSFPTLAVDKYDVAASRSGFRDFVERAVPIDANSAVRVDIQLVVGAVTSTVEVQSATLQVETESTQMGEVIGESQVESMPLNGRSFIDLLALQPGVSPYQSGKNGGVSMTGGAGLAENGISGDLTDGTQSVNGGRTGANGFMVNGGDAQEGVHNGAALIPNLDSIAEFRIITNNYDAQYGNYSGGQVNVVTKAGTNRFHGDVFDFLRNTDLDAANYETAGQRGVYIQNQFGGTFGGPIKRDRVFFFGDYQGTRQIIGQAQSFNVPSNADRTGDLTDQAANLTGTVIGSYWAGLLSQKLGYTVTSGEPYYTNGCTTATCVFPGAQIPLNLVEDPVAVNTLKYIPTPNETLNNLPGFATAAYPSTLTDNKFGLRGDANTRWGEAFVYFYKDKFNGVNPYTNVPVPGFAAGNIGDTMMGNIGLTKTFSKTIVNDARIVYTRVTGTDGTIIGGLGVSLSSLGFVTPWDSTPVGGISNVFPADAAVPIFGFNNYSFGSSASIQSEINNTWQFLDNWTKVAGTHTLQVGGEFHYDQIDQRHPSTPNGSFTFNGTETGVDFVDYLIGAPDGFGQQSFQILDTRDLYYGAYVQDSWRVRPSLTFNYGLRWEVSTPWYDATNKLEVFKPGEQSLDFPTSPQGQVEPLDPGIPRTLAPIKYHNFAPRIGIAWAPGGGSGALGKMLGGPGKTSFRIGYGVFYQGIEDATSYYESGDAPYGQDWIEPTPPLMDTPYVIRSSGVFVGIKFPFAFPPKNVSPAHPDPNFNWGQVEPIGGSEFYNPNSTTPYSQQYELSIQRQFGGATVASLSYVGTLGNHLLTGEEANPGNPALCLYLMNPANLAPGQAPCGPTLEEVQYIEANGTVVNTTRPYSTVDPRTGEFGFTSNALYSSIGHSMYNSLQASLKNQTKYGNFLVSYTYSKAMDNGSDVFDSTYVFNPKLAWALSTFDLRQDIATSYTVNLPFDQWTHSNSNFAKEVAGGWQLAGQDTFASGQPVQLSESDDRDLIGDTSFPYTRPNLSGMGSLWSGNSSKNPRKGLPYFNTSYFAPDTLGQIGTASRRFFSGPGIDNYNMSLLKNTKITEGSSLQFRAEAFNVFNHAQFENPGGNINSGSFGGVTTALDPRIMQVALKLVF
jgi:hypothetical protein